MKLKVKSQLESDFEARKKNIYDDCGPSSMACAVGWVTGYAVDPSAADGVAAKTKATGKEEKQGVLDNGSTLAELIKTAEVLAKGVDARWATSWDDVVASAKAGAAIGINVQAPKGYPAKALSKWHQRWAFYWGPKGKGNDPKHLAAGYGHMTCAVYCSCHGWQFADPTMSGKGSETYGVSLTESEVKAIASGKGDAPHKRCIVIGYKKPAAKPEEKQAAAQGAVSIPVAGVSINVVVESMKRNAEKKGGK